MQSLIVALLEYSRISTKGEPFKEIDLVPLVEEAISDLDYLISADSNNFMYYYNRAFSKLKLNDISGAIEDYRFVLRLKPDDEQTRNQLQVLIDSQKNKTSI